MHLPAYTLAYKVNNVRLCFGQSANIYEDFSLHCLQTNMSDKLIPNAKCVWWLILLFISAIEHQSIFQRVFFSVFIPS